MKQRIKIKGAIKRALVIPFIACVVLFVFSFLCYAVNKQMGWILFAISVAFLMTAILLYRTNRPALLKEMVNFATEYAQVQRKILENLAIPYGLLDRDGKIMWMNSALAELLPKASKNKSTITNFLPEITQDVLSMEKSERNVMVSYGDETFRAVLKKVDVTELLQDNVFVSIDDNSEWLVAISFFDETRIHYLQQEVDDRHLMTGLVYIDNYDEALESIESVRRSLLVALIDRKVTKYFTNFNGIVRKLEKDKYFVLIEKRYLNALTEDKFELLEEVKTVNIGNSMGVTISIAMGLDGENYLENCEYSRVAMDLALGRGGDQAVIKSGNNVKYYGGNTESMEKSTRVKARVKAQALREIMQNKDSVLIMGHQLSDMDCLGAAIGVYRISKLMGKQAHIVLEEVNRSMKAMVDRFQPEYGYDSDVFVGGQRALELLDENTLVVVVDVNRPSYTECPELLKRTKSVVVIDHHRQSSEIIENALLKYIEPYASSASELVAEIIQYMFADIRLKQQEADALYGGITIDTNNFLNKTGVRTFEAAAFLRRKGADVVRVRKLFRDNMEEYKARAEAVRNAEVFAGCFAISICPVDGVESPTIVGAQAANELLNINGIRASFVATEFNDQIYLSARSMDDVNVQVIMERLGGGGHLNVAGAQLAGCSAQQAIDLLKETLKGMIQDGDLK
ncbi:MAG: DHH family phosphoesterase [Lachnospiraceae bacterium]|nr:DHH family phosphoesterase [Lachnospiraceae bacterium]